MFSGIPSAPRASNAHMNTLRLLLILVISLLSLPSGAATPRVWVDLEAGTIVKDAAPKGPFVAGTLDPGGHFVPDADAAVENLRPRTRKGDETPGWLELATATFHRDVEAVRPRAPYVKGFRGKDGRFHPTAAKIQR